MVLGFKKLLRDINTQPKTTLCGRGGHHPQNALVVREWEQSVEGYQQRSRTFEEDGSAYEARELACS